jgi:pimeloyl-[acyl-carrier protein] methyl ester esterase
MRVASFNRWLKGEPRDWQGRLFHAAAEGRGRDLVFLHGLAASPECWDGAPEFLADDVRAHMIHMRGFAGSSAALSRTPGAFLKPMADELADYMRGQGKGPMAVMGHSMGGLVTLILARDHPDVVERAMIVDVPAFFSSLISPFATASAMGALADASRRRYMERTPAALEEELRRAAEKLVGNPGLRERVIRWSLDSDRATTAEVMAEVMVTDLRADLARIGAPVDVVYAWDKSGHSTRMGLDQLYATSYAALPRKRLRRIDQARHYVMLDQPEVFYQAVASWLARTEDL